MNVLIVDDEPIARDILERYVRQVEGLNLVGTCSNAIDAFGIISQYTPDLVLLDINMPKMKGVNLLRSLKDPPMAIFTTAYAEYAAESYDLNAIDYLMKPFSFERFLKSISKARTVGSATAQGGSHLASSKTGASDVLFVRADGKLIRIELTQLWLVEGLKDYVRLCVGSSQIIVHTTMKEIEDRLQFIDHFLRINRSYIINIKYINEVDGNTIRIKDRSVAIGNTYQDAVHSMLNKLKLL